ncbi:MAG TPA: caspase family protein [Roseiarcus sp.]|nr:caspase family protein [Roseiarcus sp.]
MLPKSAVPTLRNGCGQRRHGSTPPREGTDGHPFPRNVARITRSVKKSDTRRAKFDVVDEHDNLGVVDMKRAVRDFTAIASNADVAVIYYSGHGIEASGVNYLIPVDSRLAIAYDVEDETLPLDRLLWATAKVKSLSLIIRGGDGGPVTRAIASHVLGEQATTANTLIAYAAKAGSLSYDGIGPNSPFTTALVKFIVEPGLDIRIALGKVRDDVLAATGNQQEPFVYGSLGGDIVSLAPTAVPVSDPLAATAADYALAERVGSPDAWWAFIRAHREGGFCVDLARAQLGRIAPTPPAPPPSPVATLAALSPKPEVISEDRCKTEAERLAALRSDPSPDAIAAFAAESVCKSLRPQLNRVMEGAGLAVRPTASATIRLAARNPEGAGCGDEARELERLRADLDPVRAKALADHLACAALRPQLQRLLESLGFARPTAATSSQRAVAPMSEPAPGAETAAACTAQNAELSRLRAHPDRKATLDFASAMLCKALKPQVARVLESFGD